jgi:hypothetical protein
MGDRGCDTAAGTSFVVARLIALVEVPVMLPQRDSEIFPQKGNLFVVSRCIGRSSHFCGVPPPDNEMEQPPSGRSVVVSRLIGRANPFCTVPLPINRETTKRSPRLVIKIIG